MHGYTHVHAHIHIYTYVHDSRYHVIKPVRQKSKKSVDDRVGERNAKC